MPASYVSPAAGLGVVMPEERGVAWCGGQSGETGWNGTALCRAVGMGWEVAWNSSEVPRGLPYSPLCHTTPVYTHTHIHICTKQAKLVFTDVLHAQDKASHGSGHGPVDTERGQGPSAPPAGLPFLNTSQNPYRETGRRFYAQE